MDKFKKYLPFFVIGAIVIWLVMKLSKSGSTSQVVNRVIPVQGENNEVALKQIDAQFQLGKLQLESEANTANKAIEAEGQRLTLQNKALELTSQYNLAALQVQSSRDQALATIAGDATLYDANIRANAARELQRQQSNTDLMKFLTGTGSSLIQALLGNRNQQSQSRPQSSTGSIGSSVPTTSQQRQATRSSNSWANTIARVLDNFRNSGSVTSPNVSLAGQYVSPLDLIPYYENEAAAYDNWLNYFPGGMDLINWFSGGYEPEGTVTVDYNPDEFYLV